MTDKDPKSGHLEPNLPDGDYELGYETTGGSIVTVMDDSAQAMKSTLKEIKNKAGFRNICRMSDFSTESFSIEDTESADVVVFDELNIAVVGGAVAGSDLDSMQRISAMDSGESKGIVVEPEYMNHAFDSFLETGGNLNDPVQETPAQPGAALDASFLAGYQEAIRNLVTAMSGSVDPSTMVENATESNSETWGINATLANRSRFSGRGIRVAVLDTGLDLRHPDFAGRSIQSQSFIPNETVQDRNGHGTHCIGTACGPLNPSVGPRYGVAYESQIFVGKVLSNAGRGPDRSILGGIEWALRNRCQVISMSLGRLVRPGESPTQAYETAGRRALSLGTLIIAAAGNDSARPFQILPVSSPANASTIVAVAAVDSSFNVASFSNRGINPSGGEVNIAGPGVGIHSSWPMPRRLRSISGTSMATPHVAGIAALIAQEKSDARGVQLYREIRSRARRLPLSFADVGNGLVRAV